MNSRANIKSQAHRKLRHLENYTPVDDNQVPPEFQGIILQKGEELIGMYKTITSESIEAFLLTTDSVFVKAEQGYSRIPLSDLKSLIAPSSKEKHSANSLQLRLKSGKIETLLVHGGDEKLRDVWAFVGFFGKVISYMR